MIVNNSIVLLFFILIINVLFVIVNSSDSSISNQIKINVDKNIYINQSNSVYLVKSDEEYYLILQSNYKPYIQDILMIGEYYDEIESTGWGRLNISVSLPNVMEISDVDQAYFAGFIESTLTGTRINQMYTNFAANEFKNNDNTPSPKLIDFLTQQIEFVRSNILENNNTEKYWYSTSLVMSQFDGLVQGYQSSPFPSLSEIQLYILTSAGDLETLIDLFPSTNNNNNNKNHKISIPSIKPKFKDQLMDCSGLIRILPDYSDVYFGHTTWRYYYGMLRIYKRYNLQFNYQSEVIDYKVSFSSSPGFLSSKDDFYITSNKLAVMETTNNIFNTSLYEFTIPQSVLVWQRAIISNMIAVNSSEWVKTFSLFNSGTYQNQWMVLDYKLFTPGKPLPESSFWIAEQVPGFVEYSDLTSILNSQGFWSSYNIPYFSNIYNISGYSNLVDPGPIYQYSYSNCPRSLIFKRNATMIQNFEDMKSMLQFNQYKSDPLSFLSPLNSISSRADLLTLKYGNRTAIAFGGVDTKVTSFNQIDSLSCTAICGPSRNNDASLPPFNWSSSPLFSNISHIGLPQIFDFDWQEM